MQTLPKKVCNTCHQEKLLIEYTLYRKTAKYSTRCKECVKALKQDKPDEWEKLRRNSPQSHRYIMQYFPDRKRKPKQSDMGRTADGSSFSF